MKPPPPMFPASGYVTASVNAAATAASTALPPCFITSSAAVALYLSGAANAPALRSGSSESKLWQFTGMLDLGACYSQATTEIVRELGVIAGRDIEAYIRRLAWLSGGAEYGFGGEKDLVVVGVPRENVQVHRAGHLAPKEYALPQRVRTYADSGQRPCCAPARRRYVLAQPFDVLAIAAAA